MAGHLAAQLAVVLTAASIQFGFSAAAEPVPTPTPVEYDWGLESHTLWDGCRDYSGFAVMSDSRRLDDTTFEYVLRLRDPRGEIVDEIERIGAGPSFNHQNLAFEVCEEAGAGLYQLSWQLRWFDGTGAVFFENTRSGEVRFYRIATRSTLAVSDTTPKRGSRVTFKMRALRQTPAGTYEPFTNAVMMLAKNCSGSWARVQGSKQRTNEDGRVVIHRTYGTRQSCKFRATTIQSLRSKKSVSGVQRIFPH